MRAATAFMTATTSLWWLHNAGLVASLSSSPMRSSSSSSFSPPYSSCRRHHHCVRTNYRRIRTTKQQQERRQYGTRAPASSSTFLRLGVAGDNDEKLLSTSTSTATTTLDDRVDAPASIVFYDDVIDESMPAGVVCARGVCVLPDFEFEEETAAASVDVDGGAVPTKSIAERVLSSYWGPRALLAGASILYGTNFPLGAIMNDSLPPSAATLNRMVMASAALLPFLFRLDPKLAGPALLCGCFTALGYTTQSLALMDVSPATVAFLGAATVVVCPALEAFVNKKPMTVRDAPQTWLAATLCLAGVGILELFDSNMHFVTEQLAFGDVLALLQAVGFGTSFFLTERLMTGQPNQALPITAVQVSTSALICLLWSIHDGWIGQAGSESYGIPNLFLDSSLRQAAAAVAWTGLITTAMNRFVETSALGKMTSAEASVILATEPLWAALFAALLLHNQFGANDYVGGLLIVAACLANTLKPSDFRNVGGKLFGGVTQDDGDDEEEETWGP